MSEKITVLKMPFPPSNNHYYRNISVQGRPRTIISAAGIKYKGEVHALLPTGDRFTGRLSVGIVLSRKDRRSFDIDNYAKALLDAIQPDKQGYGGIIENDSQIDELTISRAPPGKDSAILSIKEIP